MMALSAAPVRLVATALVGAACLVLAATPAGAAGPPPQDPTLDVVGVAIVRGGQAILLATRGVDDHLQRWRFRSLDTRDLPQPIREVALAASGTKLFLETGTGPSVLDLTREYRHNAPLQYVDARDAATDGAAGRTVHRLPSQRFVSMRNGMVRVLDDLGGVRSEYLAADARLAGVTGDDVVLYVGTDRRVDVCAGLPSDPNACRELPTLGDGDAVAIVSRPGPRPLDEIATRFLVLSGPIDSTRIVDPERELAPGPPLRRAEAALRACLMLHHLAASDALMTSAIDALLREAPATSAATGEPVADWRFFRVTPDEELYAPVLQFMRREAAYPDAFETLEMLGGATAKGTPHEIADTLLAKYLRLTAAERRQRCTIYVRTTSVPGSWIIEYWFYYPFDLGGLGAHLHDPEHLFVEVDKLGGTVRRVIGAGHGYVAGNNIYSSDRAGALPIELPLFAMVEFGKHATATDIDRDGIFTPGLDENEYRERAKIWGVRDVIGSINNQLIAYDRTMSGLRSQEDALAPLSIGTYFPQETALSARACCRLVPLPDGQPELPACPSPTTDCARRSVISHPDTRARETILKEWVFPHAFLRAIYGLGPRQRLNSAGIGYAVDLYRMPLLGRLMPMPGRVGGEIFGWRQDLTVDDRDSCLADCKRATGVGVGVRYEQFVSNLFGIYTAVRVYSPPVSDIWITFGPMVEVPVLNRSNVNFQAGLSFRPYASPRFELKLSVGLWKPKSNHFGIRAGHDHEIPE